MGYNSCNEVGIYRSRSLRGYEDEFDWDGLEFPVSTRDINKFESSNEIGVNILAVENRKIYICRKGKDYDRVANLMLITENENPNKNITLRLNCCRDCFQIRTISIMDRNTFVQIA